MLKSNNIFLFYTLVDFFTKKKKENLKKHNKLSLKFSGILALNMD
jgi:hypothetical protein